MFSPEHMIWKYANRWDELDDWLPYAEYLINRWANQSSDEIKFKTTYEIITASFLLMDDLLPLTAKKAFANLTLDVISEVDEKKLTMESLLIHAPPPGRKRDNSFPFKMWKVRDLIEKGHSRQEAYELVASQFHKSPETIRRAYERVLKGRKKE